MRGERFLWAALWALTAAVVVTHVLGAGPVGGQLWGADAYAFLPHAALVAGCLLLLAAALLLSWRWAGVDRALLALPAPSGRPGLRAGLVALAAVALSFLVFWLFREGHTLLGDGIPLTRDLPRGQRFHPHEPLTYVIHHAFYGLARGLFAGREPAEVARGTVGLSSALAGALFVPVAWGLARELARLVRPAPGESAAAAEGPARGVTTLTFVVLLAQGYAQLFFGHVENYTFNALALGAYLLAALRCLRGAAPLALAGMALVLEIALDLSAVLMVPSFLVLLGWALVTKGRRLAALRDVAVTGAFAVGLAALLGRVEPGYEPARAALGVVLQALSGHGQRAESLAYMLSGEHLRDFLDEQLLIGPAAAFLFVAGLAGVLVARARLSAAALFMIAAGGVSLAGAWVTTDLSLGYPRDWDLFAPSGLVFTAAGLLLALAVPWRAASLRRWLALLACVALFHTVPWVAVNASFERSFARFQTLPLGLGRTEAAVGTFYLSRGDTTQAVTWFQRALDANPANNVAAFSLGRIAVKRGMYRWAARAFWTALQSRRDRADYRLAFVDAVVRGGGDPRWIKPDLDTLLMRDPDQPMYWAAYGVVCMGMGMRDSADMAFRRARLLDPEAPGFEVLRTRLAEPDGYQRAVRQDWLAIVGD